MSTPEERAAAMPVPAEDSMRPKTRQNLEEAMRRWVKDKIRKEYEAKRHAAAVLARDEEEEYLEISRLDQLEPAVLAAKLKRLGLAQESPRKPGRRLDPAVTAAAERARELIAAEHSKTAAIRLAAFEHKCSRESVRSRLDRFPE